jgi:DNA-binding NarL/FixJ family response regulator
MKSQINIVIVDDQKLIRQGIIKMLEEHEHINVVHEAGDGIEIINWLKESENKVQIDVILMDIQMPGMDGWEATELITRKYNQIKVIGLSSYDNEAFVDRFMKNGGRGYLLKVQEINEIVSAIEQVITIGYYFSDRVTISKIQDFLKNKVVLPSFNTSILSDQEIKIVQLICQEKTSQEIADELFIARKTVESHRERIMHKINAKNVVGIAMYAVKHQLIKFN